MNRLGLVVLASALFGPVPALACPARTSAGDERAVRALEIEWIGNHDRAALERILADDFRHPVFTGDVLDKRHHIDWAAAHPNPPGRRPRFARLEVRLYSDTALADGEVEIVDNQGKVLNRNLFTDVFVYRACRWQAVSAQETDIRP
jgi:Domain of unknown function (DUF4440)